MTDPVKNCTHPDMARRSWATIPAWNLDWCAQCGAIQFADHPWEVPTVIADRRRETPDPAPGIFNGVPLSDIEPGHMEQLRQVYPAEQMRPLEKAWQEFRGVVATPQRGRFGELERPEQINIDARHAVIHQTEGEKKYARCGNCGTRYQITEDPTENHHLAMQHKSECGREIHSAIQRRELLEDFHAQPMQVNFRTRAAAELEQGADTERLALTGVSLFDTPAKSRRPWWKFWRR